MLWIWIKPRGSGYCFSVYAWLERRHRGRQRGSPARLGLPELPTVHRLPRISRQAPATHLSWPAACREHLFHGGRLDSCRWALTLACWAYCARVAGSRCELKRPSEGWCPEVCHHISHSDSVVGWGVDRGLGGGARKRTGRGLRVGAVGAHGWPCSKRLELLTCDWPKSSNRSQPLDT